MFLPGLRAGNDKRGDHSQHQISQQLGALWAQRDPSPSTYDDEVEDAPGNIIEDASTAGSAPHSERGHLYAIAPLKEELHRTVDGKVQLKPSFDTYNSRVAVQGTQNVSGNVYFDMRGAMAQTYPMSSPASDSSFTVREQDVLKALSTIPRHGSYSQIEQPLGGTLRWVFEEPQFISWRSSQGGRLLTVTGYAGCGKSVLMRHICQSLDGSLPERTLLCRFFCGGKSEQPSGTEALLRSLIHQILTGRRKLMRLARKSFETLSLQAFQSFEELLALFEKLLSHQRIGELYLVIDAIDECKEEHTRSFLSCVLSLIKSTPGIVKLLISCQPGAPAMSVLDSKVEDGTRLCMEQREDVIAKDVHELIRQSVGGMVAKNICSAVNAENLQRILLTKAGGTFLWVSVELSRLRRRAMILRHDVDAIAAEAHVPVDLATLYTRCLAAIPDEEQEYARSVLRMILASFRPLLIEELSLLLAIRLTDHSVMDISRRHEDLSARSLQRLLGPLVKASEHAMLPVHSTLEIYMLVQHMPEENAKAQSLRGEEHSIHLDVTQKCMRYLMLDGLGPEVSSQDSSPIVDSPTTSSSTSDMPDQGSREGDSDDDYIFDLLKEEHELEAEDTLFTADQHKLFDYAARYWTVHFSHCRVKEQELMREMAIGLLGPEISSKWLVYLHVIDMYTDGYPKTHDALVLAAFFGLNSILKWLLQHSPANFRIESAIYWAACQGHQSCLEALLALDFVSETSACHDGISPLAIAASNGHLGCVHALLKCGRFSINKQTRVGRTPISLAAGAGHLQVVARLLKEDAIDVNLPDDAGAPPVFWAAANKACSTLRCLLGHCSLKLDVEDCKKQSALFWACKAGSVRATRRLLRDSRCDPNIQNNQGRTALMVAVEAGDLATVQAMTQYNSVRLDIQDREGRNAISWAAQGREYKILECLLHCGRTYANIRDTNGWGPLAWTLDPPGRLQNAQLLIEAASEDINKPDHSGTPILILAMKWTTSEIVQLLVESDKVRVDQPDRSGRTALEYAVARGDVHLVRQLLGRKPSATAVSALLGRKMDPRPANCDIIDNMLAMYCKSSGGP